ncbi:MAG: DNA mismatch repair endonuclease MutL [Amoebophilaceae bacterium]|nr:DNA mismatch repair endonuclease MutL [Amoebophilaceae bacterium]
MSNIRLLSDLLVNQIAAGEVVQRPASVVKELLDNSIDAQSTTIKVIIKEAGKQLIQVIDDGIGMDEVDARLCFEKHTTSKIATTEDLFNIHTMGFRGEAMASMAAVAHLQLETRLHAASLGSYIEIEGSNLKKQEAIATAAGTNIRVKHLFYNVPARRNFLKSNPLEFKHIVETLQHAALARPDIAFSLYHNDTTVYQLHPEKINQRIVHLFGEPYKKQLIPCEETTHLLSIKGYIGKPEQAKKTRGEQFLFVNQRFIKSPFLNHAIKNAYDRLLPSDSFPFYVIYLTIDPRFIDINVHPTKMEIKFQDEKMLYTVMQAVIKKSLATHHVMDPIDFEQNVNFSPLAFTHPVIISPSTSARERNYVQFKNNHASAEQFPSKNWEDLFTSSLPSQAAEPVCQRYETGQAVQLYGSYIITQVQSGTLLIDQQAAHERILYDKFSSHLEHKSGVSQQLMIPEPLELNPTDYLLLLEHEAVLRSLGFVIDPFGSSTVIIHGHPIELNQHSPKALLEAVIEQLKWNNTQLELSLSENLIRALAKRASIPPGKKLTVLEIDALLAQLFSATNTMYTPDGRKICLLLPQADLAAMLK